ncbi:MAG: AAA family ATPase [Blautia faecis]
MLISGPSKAGKSFLQIELCIAIAEGKKWLQWHCAQGRVMYVNLELDRASCLHRFKDVYESMGICRQRTCRTLISGTFEESLYLWISLHQS